MSDTDTTNRNSGPTAANTSREGQGDSPAMSEREAYFQALQLWIQQAQMYQNLSTCFPYYMMSFQGLQNNATNVPLLNNNYQFQGQPFQAPMPEGLARRPNVPDIPPSPFTLTAAEGTFTSPQYYISKSFLKSLKLLTGCSWNFP